MRKFTYLLKTLLISALFMGTNSAWGDVDLATDRLPSNELYYVSFQKGSNQLYGPDGRDRDWECYAQDANGVKVDKNVRYVECTIGTGDDASLEENDVINITYVAGTEGEGYWMKLYYNDGSSWVSEEALTLNSGMTPSVTDNKHINNTTYTVSYTIPDGSPLIGKKVFRVYVSNTDSSSKGHYVKILKVLRTGADDCRPNTLTGTSKSWDFEGFNTVTTTKDIVNDDLFYKTGVKLTTRTSGTYTKAVALNQSHDITFWVPAGTGKVELICSSSNEHSARQKIGNNAIVTLGSVKYAQKIYTFGYNVTEDTPITISGDGKSLLLCHVHAVNVSMGQETVTLNATYPYASYSCVNDIDVDGITTTSGTVTVYKASSSDGSTVTLDPVTGKVPAGTGLIIKGTVGGATVTIPYTTGASALEGTNLLKALDQSGNLTSSAEPSGTATTGTNYVLTVQDEKVVFAQIDATSAPMKAGQAYLNVPSVTPAKSLRVVVDGEASEVVAPEVADTEEDEVLYNMAGIQVDKNFKGIVINQKGVKRFNR